MNKLKLILILLYGFFMFVPRVEAKTVKIVVIDTGYSGNLPKLKVCPNGERDFTGEGMVDLRGHGTNILGIIDKELRDIDYCVYIFKVYGEKETATPFVNMLNAYIYSYYIKDLDIINFSSTGTDYSDVEEAILHLILQKNIKFVAAAGNERSSLDKSCNFWPACIKGVISVGNLDKHGLREYHSNYGDRVTAWEKGTEICILNRCFTGTSMAAAVHTSRLAKELANHK